MRLALHQPDQAGNVGTILRLAACLGVPLDVIEPCGFPWGDRAPRRAGMDFAPLRTVASNVIVPRRQIGAGPSSPAIHRGGMGQ